MTDVLVNGRVIPIPPGFRLTIMLEQLPEAAAIVPGPSELVEDEERRLDAQRRMREGGQRGAAMSTAKRTGVIAAGDIGATNGREQWGRKTCPECREKSPPALQECACGYRWPRKHHPEAGA